MAPGIITETYCKDSGKLMSAACYADPRGNRAETGYFTLTTVPTEFCDRHVMVEYDTSTGGIAHEGCPTEHIKSVGLLRVDRLFPMNVKVTDTQYTYRDVYDGIVMPTTGDLPFYVGLYSEGEYPGYSDTAGKRLYNSYCYEHHVDTPTPGVTDDSDDTGYEDSPNKDPQGNPDSSGTASPPDSSGDER